MVRRFTLLPLAVLAACGFTPATLTPGDDAGTDADVDAPDVDTDGDGIIDRSDNCPAVGNADQRDHDLDALGDPCDLCPHLATVGDPDGDGDAVGDACDPRPTMAGDLRVLWEGFYDAADFATWQGVGAWSVAGGKLTQASSSLDLTYTYPSTVAIDRHAVTAGVTIDEPGMVSGNDGPGVSVAGGIVDTTRGYYCSLAKRADNRVYSFGFWQDSDNVILASDYTTWPGTYAAGTTATLYGRMDGANHLCTVAQGTDAPVTAMGQHGPTRGIVLLSTQRAAASFDYIFVVSIGS